MKIENVWNYPRPPSIEPVSENITVRFAGTTIADTDVAFRVLETSHAPTYYLPRQDILPDALMPSGRRTLCEWKGQAIYYDVTSNGKVAAAAAWTYTSPVEGFQTIAGYIAFYAEQMDACYVGDERVEPQPGTFYGGWVTPNLVGSIKGAAGTMHW
ncbi:MAG: DUF427 domain-containing protein [Hyphomicrobiaceae bacterium]